MKDAREHTPERGSMKQVTRKLQSESAQTKEQTVIHNEGIQSC